jgi:hypothetical protein
MQACNATNAGIERKTAKKSSCMDTKYAEGPAEGGPKVRKQLKIGCYWLHFGRILPLNSFIYVCQTGGGADLVWDFR